MFYGNLEDHASILHPMQNNFQVPNQHHTSAPLMCIAMWQAGHMYTLLLHKLS